jgi:hypothetical protein
MVRKPGQIFVDGRRFAAPDGEFQFHRQQLGKLEKQGRPLGIDAVPQEYFDARLGSGFVIRAERRTTTAPTAPWSTRPPRNLPRRLEAATQT